MPKIDADLAAKARAAGCAFCGGRLDVADYPRRPRGADGLVETEGSRLTVTEVGRLVVRDICAVFDVSFREAEARQSRAK